MITVTEVDETGLGRLVAVHNAVRPGDPTTPAMMVDWKRQASDTVWLVASIDGVDAGVGIGVAGWHAEPGVARIEIEVLEAWRGHRLAGALLGRLGDWAIDGGHSHADASVDERDAVSLAWAQKRGFHEIGRDTILTLDLRELEPPLIDPPLGITITSWAERPDATRGMYEVASEAYPDVPGEAEAVMESYEKWRASDLEGASDRAEATFVALAGAEVVGYAKLSLSDALPNVAFHDMTGVKRAWRGRGIAGALKRAEIAFAIEMGYEKLQTHNEARNEPIRVLNERHGYVAEPGTIRVRGALSAAS